ncbi:hypothetical protein D9758_002077 [Tetrapyrgos nigripes]|uniref:Major facilitator superfamily (MFS) profile domain-containing protein n=1 Tax=Tetrapyrgos nigripes TaxID=182062 RepID=A0A8H5GU01_9AGAR|nr:hypothetical protein D9758_002077 [Tetrapyrgos nigripes]
MSGREYFIMSTHKETASIEKKDNATVSLHDNHTPEVTDLNIKLANPLAGLSHEQLMDDGKQFAESHGLSDLTLEFQKGALVAQDPLAFESLPLLDEDDKNALRREITHKWDQPKVLYYLVALCSMAAAVQGMDESVINGANIFFPTQLGIDPNTEDGNASRNQWLLGLVNSAPYLCCAVLGCWLTDPLNKLFGRRGTIFITGLFSFLTCIWQGVTNSWQHLFVARFVLGLGIGPKSSTVPVYAAECAPPAIRGALVMMWQTWTAFGIMIGTVMDLAFYRVSDVPGITGLNWRLMLGSAGVPALFIIAQVFFCPESPRWYLTKGRYRDAYNSLARLRHKPIQAARDLYYIHVLLEAEKDISVGRNRFLDLFTVPRNRRATLASSVVMFMQQFCGALIASWGFGMLNWLFALPAIWTIDTFGRRFLLLTTFPLMAIFLLMTGFAFYIPAESDGQIAVVALGIYLFVIAYSPGEGPVPFTYSAEAFPLYVRDIGMSYATAMLWFFNFVIAITFPRLLGAFKPQGAFGCVFGFFAALFFVPETKALSLEELDQVFSVPTHTHASYQLKAVPHFIKRYIFRMEIPDLPPLYKHEGSIGAKTYLPSGAGPVYALDWCKTTPPGQQRTRSAFRLGIGSFCENYQNRIAIIGLQDERVLVEDDYTDYPDFVTLCEAPHNYPVTSLQWQPASAASFAWTQRAGTSELLATTGDALRIWDYVGDGQAAMSNYVGRQATSTGHSLSMKTALSGVRSAFFLGVQAILSVPQQQSKGQNQSNGAPITNFSWNEKMPSLIVTASIDTTCTVWNIDTSTAVTQLIAHDREVYDVAWLPGSTDIFVSVGADGSLRAFDLRSLEHSTILYETPAPKNVPPPSSTPSTTARPPTSPLLRIAFNPSDSNYMSTFHMDGNDIQILDMRSPGQPVMELKAHHAQINGLGWGTADHPLLASAGDDCQVLLWDLANYTTNGTSPHPSAGSRLNSPRPDIKKKVITEPVMAYTAPSQVTNLAWSPLIPGFAMNAAQTTATGEWLAIASGKSIKALKV